jgi:hypothetical protein
MARLKPLKVHIHTTYPTLHIEEFEMASGFTETSQAFYKVRIVDRVSGELVMVDGQTYVELKAIDDDAAECAALALAALPPDRIANGEFGVRAVRIISWEPLAS